MGDILVTFFKWGIIVIACIMIAYTVIRLCLPYVLIVLGALFIGFICYCLLPVFAAIGTGPFIALIIGALFVIALIVWLIKSFFNLFK